MAVAIIAGRGGTGKTSQLVTLAQVLFPTKWAIMEKKDEHAVKAITGVSTQLIHAIDKDYNIAPQKVLMEFGKWRDVILHEKDKIACVVIDGISDLRGYAIDEWIQTHPIFDSKTGKERQRESIGAENIGAWGEINKRVQSLIEPLVNYALYNKVHLFMTTQMRDVYIGNNRMGQEPDIKDWLEYPCECLLVFTKDKRTEHYECSCEKAPLWSGDSGWVEELRKETGLLEVLSAHGLL